jgi:hypothetical protein
MAQTNLAQIANLTRPGLKALFGMYASWPTQWSEIFTTYPSDKAYELDIEMKPLGMAQIRAEGSPTAFDTMGQRFIYQYIIKTVSIGFQITQQAIEDNLYKSKFPASARSLKKSMDQAKEVLAASVLNNGFSSNFPLGDGQPLFSLLHPLDSGYLANTPTVSSDLTEAAIEAADITINKFRDQAGLIAHVKPKKLIVPPEGKFTAERLLSGPWRIGTPNNDPSAIHNMGTVPEGFRVNQYLTLPNSWYLLTDAEEGFKHYDRKPMTTNSYADFYTDTLLCKAVARYAFGASNVRSAYASGN